MTVPFKLHIGGESPKEGWKILNIQSGPNVDHVGTCLDLSQFAANSAVEIYLSHVLEHLDYKDEVAVALREFARILAPGGKLMVSVPDLDVICHMLSAPYVRPDGKYSMMRILYGGHTNPYDYHKSGYTHAILHHFLDQAGFERIKRVESFGLFTDMSEFAVGGVPISLNVEAFRPGT